MTKFSIRLLVLALVAQATVFVLAAQELKADKSSPAKEYESGLGYLSGDTTQNVSDGLRHIRSSADQGYAPAQDALGAIYNEGQFVTRDPQQAISWYKKAASQGDGVAAMSLGYFYFSGTGVSRDLDAAKKWFTTAAALGDPISQYYLGLIAEQKDHTKAPELYRKAAEQGLVQAQLKLAAALDFGRGIMRDPVEAFVWYLVAADPGGASVNDQTAKLEAEIGSTAAQSAREKAVSLRSDTNRARNSLGCFDWPGREQDQPTPPPLSAQLSCRR